MSPSNFRAISVYRNTIWVQVASSHSTIRLGRLQVMAVFSRMSRIDQISLSAPSARERMIACSCTGVADGSVRMMLRRRRGRPDWARLARAPGSLICTSAWQKISASMKPNSDDREKRGRIVGSFDTAPRLRRPRFSSSSTCRITSPRSLRKRKADRAISGRVWFAPTFWKRQFWFTGCSSQRYRFGEDRPEVISVPSSCRTSPIASGPIRTTLGQTKALRRPERRAMWSRPKLASANSTRLSSRRE